MGIMAFRAFPFPNRLVYYPLLIIDIRFIMTRIAKFLQFLKQQGAVTRHVGTVAGQTFSGGSGFMFYFFLKRVPVMARETIHLRPGRFSFMAGIAAFGLKRFMAQRVKQVLFRAPMGIVTGNTGFASRCDLLVGVDEF
jgi:hypothetical protein